MKKLNLKLAMYAFAAFIVISISAFSYLDTQANGNSPEVDLANLNLSTKSSAACPEMQEYSGKEECYEQVPVYHNLACSWCDDTHDFTYWSYEMVEGEKGVCKPTEVLANCSDYELVCEGDD